VLPARVAGYRPQWLDGLCLSGEVAWARLSPRASSDDERPSRGGSPSRATPLALVHRDDLDLLLALARDGVEPALPTGGPAADVLGILRTRGALFYRELVSATGRLPVEVEEGLWELVSRGIVTADGFQSVRGLLGARERWARSRSHGARRGRRRTKRGAGVVGAEGRWALLPPADEETDREERAEVAAEQLLARWGVVFRDLLARENLALPWRDVLWALRRMEARGTARGGRFVTGFSGEQYALPDAVDALRRTRKRERTGETVRLSGVDPLNLVGTVVPGARVPAVRTQTVVYRDGAAVDEAAA
jgi:ATP-dependent Lhr-like helicase